jgi:phosphonate transport system substrate-binding protein
VLAEALSEATGLTFDVGIVESEAALLQLLCDAPGDAIGFMSAAGYVLTEEQCEAQVGPVAQDGDNELPWQVGMIVTRRDSGIDDIEDLDGKRWAVADSGGLPTLRYFQAEMAANGIEPGEIMTFPEDSSALLAVLNGDADFATAAYVPPILPFGEEWTYGEDMAEAWRITGISPQRSPIGYVLVNGEPEQGGYRLRDARARLFDTTPTIFDETSILALSQPVPNQTVVFGGDIPQALVREIRAFLIRFGASEACATSLCAGDLYGWAGLQAAEDDAYDPVRFVIEQLALTAEELGLTDEQGE